MRTTRALAEGIAEEKIAEFEARYDSIMQTTEKEYEDICTEKIVALIMEK